MSNRINIKRNFNLMNDSFGFPKNGVSEEILVEKGLSPEKYFNEVYEFSLHKKNTINNQSNIQNTVEGFYINTNSNKNKNQSNKRILFSNHDTLFSGCFGRNMDKNEINDNCNLQNINKNIKPFDDIIEENNDLNYEEDNGSFHKMLQKDKIRTLNEFQTVLKPRIVNTDKSKNFEVPINICSENNEENKKKKLDRIFHSLSLSNLTINDKSRNNDCDKENKSLFTNNSYTLNKTYKSTSNLISNVNNNLAGDSKTTIKKKVILSSEEIELQRIRKKKEEIKNLMKLNEKNIEKHKYLMSNNNSDKENNQMLINANDQATLYSHMLKKKRLTENLNKENLSNNGSYYNRLMNNASRKDRVSNVSRTKNIKNFSKNLQDLSNNDVEFEIDYITKNMEIACNISQTNKKKDFNLIKNNVKHLNNKSPLRYCFEKDSVMNSHIKKIENDKSRSKSRVRLEKSPVGISIRKTFEFTKNETQPLGKYGREINTFTSTIVRNNQNLNDNFEFESKNENNCKRLIKGISVKTFSTLNVRKNKAPNINTFESLVKN